MTDEHELLQQFIASGQVSAAQAVGHAATGDLNGGAVLVNIEGETRWMWPDQLADVKLPYEVVTEDITTNCPWCGARGLDYDESPMPLTYCYHDDPPFSLSRQMHELRRAELKALDESLAPARQKLFTDFLQIAKAHQGLDDEGGGDPIPLAQPRRSFWKLRPLTPQTIQQVAEKWPHIVIDEVTIPKDERRTCISCGQKQEPDGTLPCGH